MSIDPEQCQTMTDVRAGVDAVDRQVVALIARRFGYMDAAARLKPDRAAVVTKSARQRSRPKSTRRRRRRASTGR